MLKEAIEKILSLAPAEIKTFHGLEYSDKKFSPVLMPVPDALELNTLSGVVEMIRDGQLDRVDGVMLHVLSHDCVRILGPIEETVQRACFAEATTAYLS